MRELPRQTPAHADVTVVVDDATKNVHALHQLLRANDCQAVVSGLKT
jgi:hypothetical protein